MFGKHFAKIKWFSLIWLNMNWPHHITYNLYWMSLFRTFLMTHSGTLRSFAIALIYFRVSYFIFWTFHANLSILMVLGPLTCILHPAADIGSPTAALSYFWTLIIQDQPIFRKQAIFVSLCCAFKAMITFAKSTGYLTLLIWKEKVIKSYINM